MAVLYKLHKIVRTFKDGRTDKANNKWFARAITVGTTDTDKLAEIIQEKCTLTKADIKVISNCTRLKQKPQKPLEVDGCLSST